MNTLRTDLENKITLLNEEIERYKLENSVFQRFIDKKTLELGADEDDKRRKRNKKTNVALLTSEQKFDISNTIYEDLIQEIENNKVTSEKMIDTLKAVLEETEIRINELKRDAYEFKRDVVVGAENTRTGKIMAERVLRYFEDKFKKIDAYIEKLRLKNSSIKNQIAKIENQLIQKEEAGDVLHYIDFHQLQIENKNYLTKIDERNNELLVLKISTSKTVQALNDIKHLLNDKLNNEKWLNNEIKNKRNQYNKLLGESSRVSKESNQETRNRDKLRMLIEESSEMPNIEDYIMQKKEMYELQNSLKNWKKKVEIMEIAAKRARAVQAKIKF